MPGTLVHDASGPVLKATTTVLATFTGAAVQVDRIRLCRVKLSVPGVVSGTNPTLDVEIQASDDSAFGTSVSLGKFVQVIATTGTTPHYLTVDCQKTYMRAVGTVGGTGTPTFTGTIITVEELHYEQANADTA